MKVHFTMYVMAAEDKQQKTNSYYSNVFFDILKFYLFIKKLMF